MKTFTPKSPAKDERKWYIVDATDKVLGRLATEIAVVLRGKNKPSFTHHLDMGDYVVVINAEKIKVKRNIFIILVIWVIFVENLLRKSRKKIQKES